MIERLGPELGPYGTVGPAVQDHEIEMLPSEIIGRLVMGPSKAPRDHEPWSTLPGALAASPPTRPGPDGPREEACGNAQPVEGFRA